MNFDFAKIPFEQAYKLVVSTVVPRPVAWVVTKDKDGVVNAAPYSFFNAFSDNPVVVGFGCGPRAPGALKDTVANIEATGQFVVNMVSADLAEKMNITAVDFPPGVSEDDVIDRINVAAQCHLKKGGGLDARAERQNSDRL